MADKLLDVRGMPCPYPIVKARKAILEIADGGTLEVIATDPGSPADFAVLAKTTGHLLVSSTEDNGVFRFVLQRSDEIVLPDRPNSAS